MDIHYSSSTSCKILLQQCNDKLKKIHSLWYVAKILSIKYVFEIGHVSSTYLKKINKIDRKHMNCRPLFNLYKIFGGDYRKKKIYNMFSKHFQLLIKIT
ncbi:hypothetical protein PFNF135_00055 [Plasmodium falciparum NF135/5.C10]|uniref:Uncharacterized protein n=1 Tax=Plasmodium falciparum NF135/5.C10 TaxID=1036726 RepID=W4IR70_PLAFA|nr:hypothetical protein PFNF135_00055 [Plasmodium falciparum NF135/5.C10]